MFRQLSSEGGKKFLMGGALLLLLVLAATLLVLLQWQFNFRLNQIQAAALNNSQRLSQIESFLGQLSQLQQQPGAASASSESSAIPQAADK